MITSCTTAQNTPHKLFRNVPVKQWAQVWMQEVKPAFAVAYFLGDVDEKKDKRPALAGDPFAIKDASGKAEDRLPTTRVLLGPSGRGGQGLSLDVANLLARARQRARLPLDKLTTVVEAVVQPEAKAPIKECYDPHHVVICYDESGVPCGAVEICVSCNACRVYSGPFQTQECDIVKVARVLVEAGLPLSGEKNLSIEDYAREVAREIREVEKWREAQQKEKR